MDIRRRSPVPNIIGLCGSGGGERVKLNDDSMSEAGEVSSQVVLETSKYKRAAHLNLLFGSNPTDLIICYYRIVYSYVCMPFSLKKY